ncbi:hypothetical protein M3Y98_00364700 [Aphelenchoides besseyi]|nr:hypothetical protein M3Y98_00364700 [Aphelenchoides besseyi]
MDSEVSTIDDDLLNVDKPKCRNSNSAPKSAALRPEVSTNDNGKPQLLEFSQLDFDSDPLFDGLNALDEWTTPKHKEDPKTTAVNKALDRQLKDLDGINATLDQLDNLTKYTDDLMNGIIDMNSSKVDELLVNKTTNKKRSCLCVYCNLDCHDSVHFLNHLITRHVTSTKKLFCVACSEEFENADKLKVHVDNHFVESSNCSFCGIEEANEEHAKTHKLEQCARLKLVCDFCSFTTFTSDEYALHNMVCSNNPENSNYVATDEGRVCAVCKQVFGCNSYMLKHRKNKHEKSDDQNALVNQYKCEDCGRRFGSVLSLAGHSKIHKRHQKVDLIKMDKLKRPEDRQNANDAPQPKRRRTAKTKFQDDADW